MKELRLSDVWKECDLGVDVVILLVGLGRPVLGVGASSDLLLV